VIEFDFLIHIAALARCLDVPTKLETVLNGFHSLAAAHNAGLKLRRE